MKSYKLLVPFILLLSFSILFSTAGCSSEKTERQGKNNLALKSGPPEGGDFTLQSANGPVSLHDMRGKVVILFFGYTFCPDVCPTTLHIISDAFSRLSLEELENVQGLFISIDPDRDTLEGLKEYSAYFHPNIIGVTDDTANIKKTAKKYGAFFIKSVKNENDKDYSFSHSTEIYLIDKKGNLSEIYSDKTKPRPLSEAIRRLLLQT